MFKPAQIQQPTSKPAASSSVKTKTIPGEPTPKPTNTQKTFSHHSPKGNEPPDCDIKPPYTENKKPNQDTLGGARAKEVNKPARLKTKVVHASDLKLFLDKKKKEREMKNILNLEVRTNTTFNHPPSEPYVRTTLACNFTPNPLPQIATIHGDNTTIAPPASNIEGDRCDELNGTQNKSGDL